MASDCVDGGVGPSDGFVAVVTAELSTVSAELARAELLAHCAPPHVLPAMPRVVLRTKHSKFNDYFFNDKIMTEPSTGARKTNR